MHCVLGVVVLSFPLRVVTLVAVRLPADITARPVAGLRCGDPRAATAFPLVCSSRRARINWRRLYQVA